MVFKNGDIYEFLAAWWVLINMVPCNTSVRNDATVDGAQFSSSVEGPCRPYYNPICFSFHISEEKKRCFPQQLYTISSIIVACETRITENGIPPEPNLRMVSFIS